MAWWVINEGLLSQFALAKEQIDYTESRAKKYNDNNSVDNDSVNNDSVNNDSAGEEDPGQG